MRKSRERNWKAIAVAQKTHLRRIEEMLNQALNEPHPDFVAVRVNYVLSYIESAKRQVKEIK